MNLTNRQLTIVVDEIYDRISVPIIKMNEVFIDSVKLGNYEYFQDLKEFNRLKAMKETIKSQMDLLEESYENKTIDGFKFNSYRIFEQEERYTKHLKKQHAEEKPYLTKEQIEKQVILAGNKDIPSLIEELVNKLSK